MIDGHFSHDGRIVVSIEDQLTTYQVEPALEYRTLAHRPGRGARLWERGDPARWPSAGRWARAGGVVLWDIARGTELAFLPIGKAENLLFEASGDLLTSGSIGVRRWPVRLDLNRGEFRIGPPHPLPLPAGSEEIAEDRSGRVVALAGVDTAYVHTPERAFAGAAARRRPVSCRQPGRGILGNRQPWQDRRPGLANTRRAGVKRIWRSRGLFALSSAPTGNG